MQDVLIINKFQQLPDSLKKEVSDFIDFLVSRKEKNPTRNKNVKYDSDRTLTLESNVLSDSALAEDWADEDDEYWASYLVNQNK